MSIATLFFMLVLKCAINQSSRPLPIPPRQMVPYETRERGNKRENGPFSFFPPTRFHAKPTQPVFLRDLRLGSESKTSLRSSGAFPRKIWTRKIGRPQYVIAQTANGTRNAMLIFTINCIHKRRNVLLFHTRAVWILNKNIFQLQDKWKRFVKKK